MMGKVPCFILLLLLLLQSLCILLNIDNIGFCYTIFNLSTTQDINSITIFTIVFLNNVDYYFYDYDVDYYRPPLLANNRWNSIFIKNYVLKKTYNSLPQLKSLKTLSTLVIQIHNNIPTICCDGFKGVLPFITGTS